MVIIQLTQGKSTIIDDSDTNKVSRYKWYANKVGNTWYARTNIRRGKTIYLHQLIIKCKKGQEVDHRNHNGLDCRRENLRKVTRSQNTMNHRIHKDNKSGFRGVCFFVGSKRKHWRATINVNRKQIHVGLFATAIEAARAYNAASIKYHGDFGYRNFIPEH